MHTTKVKRSYFTERRPYEIRGSRFVIISQNEYKDKMLGQLNNDLHYNKLNHDPTSEHFEKIKNWGRKWFSEGQISQKIATWVANLEPKPGVASGNVKTHKEGNPLRLITSCCGTAIERLSSSTEFYLKRLAQALHSQLLRTPQISSARSKHLILRKVLYHLGVCWSLGM